MKQISLHCGITLTGITCVLLVLVIYTAIRGFHYWKIGDKKFAIVNWLCDIISLIVIFYTCVEI